MPRFATRIALAIFVALTLGARPARAQLVSAARDPLHAPGQEVDVSLLTMGRGEHIWELFGHAAIWIHDRTTGRDTVFNWGVFNMREPNFVLHFLQGLNIYEMGGDNLAQVLYEYRYYNRSVVSQRLDLTTAQKDSLLHLIQVNAQPENVHYRYDYFIDNCATRPRDLLDQVTGGLLAAASKNKPGHTYRWHTLRLMQADKPLVVGVDIGLGEPSDRPTTRWDDMFLPRELHDVVATVQVRDSTGALHPLVTSETMLFQSTRPDEPRSAPTLGPWLWAIGAVLAILLAWLGRRALEGGGGARFAAATAFALYALAAGLLGVVLTLLWTATDHRFAHQNENLLLFNPLWLLLVVLAPMYFGGGRAAIFTRRLAWLLVTICGAALLAHLVRLSQQDNLAVIGLALPPALAMAMVFSSAKPGRLALDQSSRGMPLDNE